MVRRLFWMCCGLLFALPVVALAIEPAVPPVRVMSFNIRYGTAKDGDNHWDKRRDLVAKTIREFNPDLLGTQETIGFQKEFLAGQLPEYEAFGVGREDGGDKGETTSLFYRRDRFERLDGGHFWLSETPEVPGSISWDSSLPRICSWVKLRDRLDPQKPVVWFFNTHFDHRGPQARLESARLLRSRIEAQCGRDRVIVTGDFNAGEGSEPYRALLVGTDEAGGTKLLDTRRVAHPQHTGEEVTYNNFKPESRVGGRIDWIVVRGWQVESAEIDHTVYEGRTPSDHWPITAVLRRAPE